MPWGGRVVRGLPRVLGREGAPGDAHHRMRRSRSAPAHSRGIGAGAGSPCGYGVLSVADKECYAGAGHRVPHAAPSIHPESASRGHGSAHCAITDRPRLTRRHARRRRARPEARAPENRAAAGRHPAGGRRRPVPGSGPRTLVLCVALTITWRRMMDKGLSVHWMGCPLRRATGVTEHALCATRTTGVAAQAMGGVGQPGPKS
jgi:hypothetical protein